MVVDNTQKTSNAIFSTTTKVKEKNTSAEETLLNKLFATIDAGNATNNTKA
nr:hypothetical protein [Campylobacter jejuni]